MPTKFDRLQTLLAELFQLDQADLDFGIYRIMNLRREEITRFLRDELLPQVRTALAGQGDAGRAEIQAELRQVEQSAQALGMDPNAVPKVQQLRERLAAYGADPAALEDEVYSHLYDFFRRYYDEGDFISTRRYKEGVYAIPYEGEEVKLHWANADQYYIKTAENFRDYAFRLSSGRRVHFKLVEAEADRDNVKAAEGKDRRFMLGAGGQGLGIGEVEGDELVIRFEYRADPEKRRQTELNTLAAAAILAGAPGEWVAELGRPMPTEANPRRTLLDKHLADYTARNSFDYFIHKDLAGFLRRELDFYIKNEVVRLDDIESETAPRVEAYLGKVRALRQVGHKIIDFLAQIEEFQKRLWLKKKFVVETNYCVTLDRVPEALYPEIAANDSQRAEWVRIFAIDEIVESTVMPPYSAPLTVAFLKANPFLVLDTRFFDAAFRDRLVSSFDDLDGQTDGLLVHSENFQALALVGRNGIAKADIVFIDPPYNTGIDGFPYKDTYQHASWLAMMANRLVLCHNFMSSSGLLFITIDYVEAARLKLLCDEVYGHDNFLADVAWEKRYTRSNNAKLFYSLKDTVLCYRATGAVTLLREARSEKSRGNYSNPDNDPRGPWISSSYVNPARKEERRNLVYPITNPMTGKRVEHPTHAWKYDRTTHDRHVTDGRLYWGLQGDYEYPRLKTFLSEADEGMVPIDVWHYKETGTTDDGGNELKALFGSSIFDNPKPTSLVRRALQLSPSIDTTDSVVDFFAGSGTTAHAVINLNREDDGHRKYLLVEMGDYFDTVLKPRIQKVIYARDWQDGKPVSRAGSSHLFKYLRLESYEDTLNNLAFRPRPGAQLALAQNDAFREDYTLHYMLDAESRASLLNVRVFEDPFGYTLNVATGTVGETRPVTVDLVETFNYLLGLRVRHVDAIQGYRVVQGLNPQGERVLVIWRNLREKSNADLEAFFRKQDYNPRDMEFDLIYVNGDNHLENLRRPDETWKVRLIEEEFMRLMFDVGDV